MRSSSSLSREALKALSPLGGLYILKKCSGSFNENACDSIAVGASKQNARKGRGSRTPEIEVQVFDPFQMVQYRRFSEFLDELVRYPYTDTSPRTNWTEGGKTAYGLRKRHGRPDISHCQVRNRGRYVGRSRLLASRCRRPHWAVVLGGV